MAIDVEPLEGGERFPVESFSAREIEILRLVAEGLSNEEIARKLYLSLNTVKDYLKRINRKLGVDNRTRAVLQAKKLGVLKLDLEIAGHSPNQPLPRNNLPAQITSFVGRVDDIANVKRFLSQCRLLTLTGIGGAGKTRLALQVAEQLLPNFKDGVYFVPLASVMLEENILWAISENLDLQFNSQGDPLKQLLGFLHTKTLLLILDNFEHLIESAGLVTDILEAAPAVKIMVTSREHLREYGEVVYPVGGMALPEANARDDIFRAEAVELMMERADLVLSNLNWKTSDLHHLVRICRLVNGMPLGIELASTWLDTLQPQEIADAIEHNLDILQADRQDVADNQQSIRAVFERSWNLLGEAEQTAFRRVAVFRGGFTLKAGEAITGVGLRALQTLIKKSLLYRNHVTGRFEIHELLRFYAEEQLMNCGEADAIYKAHASYFADFIAERFTWIRDQRQKTALQEMEADLENIRAAWRYWIAVGDVAQLKKFMQSFWVIYDVHGWYRAGIELFDEVIPVMRAVPTKEAEACLGWLLAVQGLFSIPVIDYDKQSRLETASPELAEYQFFDIVRPGAEKGIALAQQGLQILRQLEGYEDMMILPLISLCVSASNLAEEESLSLPAAQECLKIATGLEDEWAIAKAKQLLAVRAIEDGNHVEGEHLALEALTYFDANGDNWSSSVICIEILAYHAIALQEYESAKAWIRRGLQAAKEIEFRGSIQAAYWQLGFVATLEENYPEAGRYFHKALAVNERMLGGHSFIGFGRRSRGGRWGGRTLINE